MRLFWRHPFLIDLPRLRELRSRPDVVFVQGALFGKYVGALSCLNTVAQLSDCLCTQRCHHQVSILVSPQTGESLLVYFETNFSAVFWNPGHCGNLAGKGVLTVD